jgi:hypothetical protein
MSTSSERWIALRIIAGYKDYEGYEVSNLGRIRTFRPPAGRGPWRTVPKILKLHPSGRGYLSVALYAGNRATRKQGYMHHLVLMAFRGARPSGSEASHRDGNLQNNCLENLVWERHKENMDRKYAHGTMACGERQGSAKLTSKQVRNIRHLRREGRGVRELAPLFNVSPATISRICLRQLWLHI